MEDIKSNLKNNKKLIYIIIAVLIFIIALATFKYFNNPVTKFKQNLDTTDISKLQKIYNSTQSYDQKKDIENIFQDKLSSIVNEFVNGTKSYENTIEGVERYKDIKALETYIQNSKENIEKIKASKDSFNEAKKYEENNKILEAIKEYSKVIELDKNNYKIAQEYINTNKNNLKISTLAEIDNLIAQNNYVDANSKLKTLLEIMPNDADITAKSNQIKEKAKEQEIEKYKNEQEVSVESASIVVQSDTYKALYPDAIEVVIKNNSTKTIKDYNVAILAYDSNNYPLKIKPQFKAYNANYEFTGQADNANIVAGDIGGKDYGWNLDQTHGISKVIAIVKDVTYYDGTTWENPYYPYWIEQYKEKQLQE